jgi:hypothetical protein
MRHIPEDGNVYSTGSGKKKKSETRQVAEEIKLQRKKEALIFIKLSLITIVTAVEHIATRKHANKHDVSQAITLPSIANTRRPISTTSVKQSHRPHSPHYNSTHCPNFLTPGHRTFLPAPRSINVTPWFVLLHNPCTSFSFAWTPITRCLRFSDKLLLLPAKKALWGEYQSVCPSLSLFTSIRRTASDRCWKTRISTPWYTVSRR